MHLENLKIFSDLVESKSFSKAAKFNGITQSAVSQQLRSLEKYFDILILDRSQKQFFLTAEGKRLYETSQQLLQIFERLQTELLAMKKIVSGTIRVSTVYSIGLHELPPFIKLFLQEFPSVNVRVEYRRSNLVYEDIVHNSVDIGLVAFPHKNRSVETIPWREDELVLICHPKNPLAGKNKVSLNSISQEKFIGFDPDIPTRKEIDSLFRAENLQVDPVMEFDNIETVKRAVEIDAGVAIVPRATVQQEIRQKALAAIELDCPSPKRPLAIIYRKGRSLTPALEKFIAMLVENDPSRLPNPSLPQPPKKAD